MDRRTFLKWMGVSGTAALTFPLENGSTAVLFTEESVARPRMDIGRWLLTDVVDNRAWIPNYEFARGLIDGSVVLGEGDVKVVSRLWDQRGRPVSSYIMAEMWEKDGTFDCTDLTFHAPFEGDPAYCTLELEEVPIAGCWIGHIWQPVKKITLEINQRGLMHLT